MAIRDLVSQFVKKSFPIQKMHGGSVDSLHQEINQVFENFGRGLFDLSPLSTNLMESSGLGVFSPKLDVKESSEALEVTVELPGLDDKDVHVSLTDNELVVSGEKSTEKEEKEKEKEWHRMERSYGSFHRVIPLPESVDSGKAEALFKKGLLTITLPKRSTVKRETKKITVQRT